MKTLLPTLAGLLAATAILAPAAAQTCTPVEVQNLRAGEGRLMLVAYDSAADFGAKAAAVSLQLRAEGEVLRFPLCGLKGGSIAITAFQDLNSNGKLDTNSFGMPNEPWGSSGKPSNFGPPSWDSAQVALDGQAIVVKLAR